MIQYSALARANRFDFPAIGRPKINSTYSYAYHFDASLYSQFLRRWAEPRGVMRTEGKVGEVEQDSGDSRGHAESSLNVCACAWTRTGKPQMSMKPTADVRSKASPLSYVASARS